MTAGETLARDVWAASRHVLPLPGSGETPRRFEALADFGAVDLCLAKLVEPHHDATAILVELDGAPPDRDSLWGVWAAEPPHARVHATRGPGGWRLSGTKAFCSGAALVTHALLTAAADDGPRLFAVDVAEGRRSGDLSLAAPDWVGPGMERAGTRTLHLENLAAAAVGDPDSYVRRAGFWHGGAGVAACWLGGARTVAGAVGAAARGRELDEHAAAHLGAITAVLDAATAQLHAVADEIDRDPRADERNARRSAQSLRATAAAAADEVLWRTARALGPAPLAFDAGHAQHVVDLQVFVRQHHGERDLADLGRLAVDQVVRP